MATSSRASSSPSAGPSRKSVAAVTGAWLLVAVCAFALAGCKKILNGGSDEAQFHIRMVNTIEDSPTVQYSVDSTVISTATYLGNTSLAVAHPGDHTINFAYLPAASLNSSDSTAAVAIGGSFSQSWSQDRDYTIFAYGKMNDPKTFVMDEPSNKDAVADDFIEYQFVNAAPNAPSVDVYVTAPEGQITSPQKVGTIAFGEKTSPATLKLFRRADVTDTTAALTVAFTIELRDPASGAVLFNSGAQSLTEKTRLLFGFVNNIGPGPSKVRMLGLGDNTVGAVSTTDGAAVRAVHVSADSPPFDIFRDSTLSVPVARNLAFRDVSSYTPVPTGDVDLIAMPASSASVVILFVEEFSAANNGNYSAYCAGPLGSTDAMVILDDHRTVPTQSKFRFLNVAPSQSGQDALDVYVTLPGQVIDFNASTSATTDDATTFKRGTISYLGAPTDYAVLRPGTYQVRLMATGTSRVVVDTTITVEGGSVQTYTLLDDLDTASLELMPVEEAEVL
jgi:hypothetical protein